MQLGHQPRPRHRSATIRGVWHCAAGINISATSMGEAPAAGGFYCFADVP
ncbi:MAG: hypothetical protein ACOZQL_42995 [Myxococcota bacterium]